MTTVLSLDQPLETAQAPLLVSLAAPAGTAERAAAQPARGGSDTSTSPVPSPRTEIADLWGMHSFPASDPPANW